MNTELGTAASVETAGGYRVPDAVTYLLRVLAGPAAFVLLLLVVPVLSRDSAIVLATLGWMLVWWATEPVPMAITSCLPLIVFPVSRVMNATETAGLYGQPVFFWIMGFSLLGYAMQKHGLAKRFALWLLALPGVASTTRRLLFVYMLAAALVSTVLTNVAVVAMMIPVGVSIMTFIRTIAKESAVAGHSRIGAFLALGSLYAAIAGGVATVAGVPSNAVAHSLLETLTGERLSFFRWMVVGVPMFLVMLGFFYLVLLYFFPPEFSRLPSGQKFLREESSKLGRISLAEKNVLATFVIMVTLFVLPAITVPLLGSKHPFVIWQSYALSIWVVPIVVLFLLFGLPVNLREREFTLSWRDGMERSPWEAMLITTSAVAMTVALNKLGFTDSLIASLKGVRIDPTALPFVAAYLGAVMTEINSGAAATAILGNIFIPAAQQVGFNTASIAILLSNVATGIIFPWSSPATAVAYASGEVRVSDMAKVGLLVILLLPALVAVMHILFAPIL